MSGKTQHIVYAPIGWALRLLAMMPWRVLYAHADVLYFIAYHVFGYRKKVVRKNLAESFPDKDEDQRRHIERDFYRHFADYFVETVKLLHISEDDMKQRMRFENVHLIDEAIAQGQSVALYLAHVGNWEWITSLILWLNDNSRARGNVLGEVYRPLKNEWFDNFFLRLRSRFGTQNFPMKHILRVMLESNRDNRPMCIGFISDQHPRANDQDHVTLFLNHPTAVITGPEAIARKIDMRVIYLHTVKESRGHYVTTLVPMADHAAETQKGELSDLYIRLLEQNIVENPAIWLWTHKRWKHAVQMPNKQEQPHQNLSQS